MASFSGLKRNNATLLTCALIGAALVCLGGLAIGAIALLGYRLSQQTQAEPTAAAQRIATATSFRAPTELPTRATSAPVISGGTSAPNLGAIPYQAVVQINAYVEVDGKLDIGWSGSGSIISKDGLVLTNAHVVLSDRYYTVKYLEVAMTLSQDDLPVPMYRLELLQVNKDLDIAVGRIQSDRDGNPIDPASLNLPTVALGDSDSLNLGDSLTIIGYPGIGGETITLTRGDVSGFTNDVVYGHRAFIKTSATIAGGNSGGLAANTKGEMIGIPTQLGYGGEGQYVDCRVLADTNRDGVVDQNDSCVPTGGFINALRPLKLALPLIEAARRGEISIEAEGRVPNEAIPPKTTLLQEDNFSNPDSGWGEFEEADSSGAYIDSTYHLHVISSNYLTWAYEERSYQDVVVQVDARVLQSAKDGELGLVCRRQDEDNFYALEISEDGYFIIYKYVDGDYSAIADWEYSDLIPANQPVTLTAACVGTRLTLAVNDTVLASVEDDTFQSGSLALIAGTFDTPGLLVEFDNFKVFQP